MAKDYHQQDYQALVEELIKHNQAYFQENNPLISDKEFDDKLATLLAIEAKHPSWVLPHSPTQHVGSDKQTGFEQHSHESPMLSLANTYSPEEVHSFIERLQKEFTKLAFCCELKVDGLAISLIYEKGLLTKAVTRGDGKKGDVVTANIKTLQNLPHCLKGDSLPDYLEFRGEVYMEKQTFHNLNEQREEEGMPPWANPRNAAAGSLKLLDPSITRQRRLKCAVYGLSENTSFNSHFESLSYIKSLGLPTLPYIKLCENPDDIFAFYQQIEGKRKALPFEIDGIVIKLDSLQGQQKMGVTGKSPRWAVAYKFAAQQAITQLKAIALQVGRTGVVTPVAELEKVLLDGSYISRASLHNEEEVHRKDLRVGDWITLEKGGDVIPKVTGVVIEKRTQELQKWSMPSCCPSCGSKLCKLEGEVAHRCQNLSCPAQNLNQLIYFSGKNGMDIEFLGKKIVEKLVEAKLVTKPSDFYRLNDEKLHALEGFKEKSVQRLLASIEKSKVCPLPKFLMALGIRYIGLQTAELLAGCYPSIQDFYNLSFEELIAIDGIGDKVAKELMLYFEDEKNQSLIEELLELGIQLQSIKANEAIKPIFEGKTFVLTGTLQRYTRQEAAKLIKERGGKVSSSLSRNTSALLAGENPGSKLEKAKQLGVAQITEEAFIQSLKES